MKSSVLLVFLLFPLLGAAQFTTVLTDASGDGSNGALLDGTEVAYNCDASADSLWFRITMTTINSAQAADVGINLLFNIPNGGSTFNFWGQNNTNPYHTLLTVWVQGSAPSNYTGTIGLADAAGVSAQNWTNLSSGNISIVVDPVTSQVTLGMARDALIADADLPNSGIDLGFAAAVGSHQAWNDDLWAANASINITPAATGLFAGANTSNASLSVYPNPFSSSPVLRSAGDTPELVTVYNMQGALLLASRDVQAVQDALGQTAPGLYVLEVRYAGQAAPERLRVLKQ